MLNGDGSKADVKLVVNWKASTWTPGDKNSKQLDMDAYQTWDSRCRRRKRASRRSRPF